ncbi:Uncharacterized protein APZ42_025160 [Daphnia magna]|uniref:Reverse transcriptase domain-containing protein n=1 Tax=Daphnia magna TaxID=35525 RepID=A0A164TDX1_9CRUS|nr:Uncharacterized protein APZ42_025160 [Daphnia magna]
MSEASVRGIIRNVPLKDSEEDLLSLLVDQGVTKVQRFSYIASDGSRQPLKTVTLSFSTPYLPHEVIMAHEIFPVRQFIPRPALCRKCWIFGHPEETCKATPSCKQCSQHHPLTNGCQNPLKCPTCSKPGHAAGTSDCPRYSHRQQVIKFAYENKIPIAEAGKILSNQNFPNPPQLPKIYPPTNNNDDIDDLRQQISQLKTQIEIITLHQPTTTARIDALEATVDDIQEKIAPLTNLPQALDKIKVDMTSGFDSNNAQLAAIASLLQGIRPPEPKMTRPLKIIQWNARSLYKSKLQEFKFNIRTSNPHIVLISETFWRDEYIPRFSAYNTFYANRITHGGGVAILVKKNLQATPMTLPQAVNLEAVGISIKLKNNKLINIVSLYCPDGNRNIHQELSDILNCSSNSFVIAGDLNAHSDVWEVNHQQNRCGMDVADLLLNDDRLTLNTPRNLGTRPNPNGNRSSTIDLTLSSPNLTNLIDVKTGPYWGSDHLPVIIQLHINSSPLTIQNEHWKFNIQKESSKPWWTPLCKKVTKEARQAYKIWRTTLLPSDKTILNRLEAVKKRTVLTAKNLSWSNHILSMDKNTSAFWHFTKQMMNRPSNPHVNTPLSMSNGVPTSDPVEKVSVFLDEFCPIEREEKKDDRTKLYGQKIQDAIDNNQMHPLNTPISIIELNISLTGLPNKAMGRDRVHNEMLKNLSDKNKKTLLELLNISLTTGYLPPDWKNASVVPIPKPNKPPNQPESYRPISLTSCLCKTMERIINNRLKWYIEKNGLLPKYQTGFRNGCTTTDNLLRLETAINEGFNMNRTTTAVFLDLAKAYDNTWITGLLYKLTKCKITGAALRWIKNFLTDRTIAVKVSNTLSTERKLKRGVPQGCVLSPLLFNLMMADFPPPNRGCEVSLFEDDIEIHSTADTKGETERILQQYLQKIEEWANTWKLTFSVPKCVAVNFTRKKTDESELNLTLNNIRIAEKNNYKFLGVIFDSKLNWDPHINYIHASLCPVRTWIESSARLSPGRKEQISIASS